MAAIDVQNHSPPPRTANLQQMLDLEKKYKVNPSLAYLMSQLLSI